MSLIARCLRMFRRKKLEAELDEELSFHQAMRQAEFQQTGLTGEDAHARAQQRLGSRLRLKERSRDVKLIPFIDSLWQDVVYGCRMIRKRWILSAAAILSLAVAAGAVTATFSLVNALVLRPLPVKDPRSLIYLVTPDDRQAQVEWATFSYPAFKRLSEAAKPLGELFTVSWGSLGPARLPDRRELPRFELQFVSGNAFPTLGVGAQLGRVLQPSDDRTSGQAAVTVLSDRLWRTAFAADPHVLGRVILVDRRPYEIVGVASRGFTGIEPGMMPDAWAPMHAQDGDWANQPGWGWFRILGRRHPNTRSEALAAKLTTAYRLFIRDERAKNWPPDLPEAARQRALRTPVLIRSAENGPSSLRRQFSMGLTLIAIVVSLILFIACVNVANLLLASTTARKHEMALRVSIGAGRMRLLQQLLVESGLLALSATLLGLLLAGLATPLLVALLGTEGNRIRLDVAPDWRVLLFCIALCCVTTLSFGLAPALKASRVKPNTALKETTGASTRYGLENALLSMQVAVSFVVLVLAALFGLTLRNLMHTDPGFQPSGLLLFDLSSKEDKASLTPKWFALRDRLTSQAGVESAAIAGWGFFSGNAWTEDVRVGGRRVNGVEPFFLNVSPEFIGTMKMRLLRGRTFLPAERLRPDKTSSAEPVIVNESFAHRFFRGKEAIGARFDWGGNKGKYDSGQIIGVVKDAKYMYLREPATPSVYTAIDPPTSLTLMVRTRLPVSSVRAILQQDIQEIDPAISVRNGVSQEELIRDSLLLERLLATLSGFFGFVALSLAALGLYGVLNYSVARRNKEIGIRRALGATAGQVISLLVRQTAWAVGIGLAAGTVIAISLGRFTASILFGLRSEDPLPLVLAALPLLCLMVLACLSPVRKATLVDPLQAIRNE